MLYDKISSTRPIGLRHSLGNRLMVLFIQFLSRPSSDLLLLVVEINPLLLVLLMRNKSPPAAGGKLAGI